LKLKGIIIDMDGTITKFNLDYVAARRRTLNELERLGLRTPEMNEQSSLYLMLNKLRDQLEREKFLTIRSTLYGFFEEMELDAAKSAALYPGARKTLRELRSKPLKLGLVTNNSRSGTELTLRRLNLQSIFDAIVTRDDCEEMKPAKAPIIKILTELDVAPEAAILVGDGALDIMAAKAAGVRSVAVSTGPFPKERILNAEPDYLVGSVNDLPTLIERLDLNGES
jgi:HAD superfamily hydrolase (TIGR01549 family)